MLFCSAFVQFRIGAPGSQEHSRRIWARGAISANRLDSRANLALTTRRVEFWRTSVWRCGFRAKPDRSRHEWLLFNPSPNPFAAAGVGDWAANLSRNSLGGG